jgi:hypothetical protein
VCTFGTPDACKEAALAPVQMRGSNELRANVGINNAHWSKEKLESSSISSDKTMLLHSREERVVTPALERES